MLKTLSFGATLLARRRISPLRFTVRMSSQIALPCDEIEALWFDGLGLEKGKPISAAAGSRWFRGTADFDNLCKWGVLLSYAKPSGNMNR